MPTNDESVSAAEVTDLRSAMDLLRSMPGELVTTDRPVDPYLEIAGIYKLVGAGTPARPPTRVGPALFFTNVKGYGIPVVTGILASRQRTARLFGSTVEGLPSTLLDALEHPVAPVTVAGGEAPCQ